MTNLNQPPQKIAITSRWPLSTGNGIQCPLLKRKWAILMQLRAHSAKSLFPLGPFKRAFYFNIENQRVGLGIVIRNSEGKFITAAIKPSKWLDRVDYAEAEATRFGLEVAESAGCLPLIVETDSKEVSDLVSARKSTKAEIFWIVSEVQDTMKRLKHVKLQHSPRTCNGFAHTLAKLALDYTDCVIWEDNLPTHLLYLFTELND